MSASEEPRYCRSCRKLLQRKSRESALHFAMRRYCDRVCGGRGESSSAFTWSGKPRPARERSLDVERIPGRLREVLADAAERHPDLLKAFALKEGESWTTETGPSKRSSS